LRQACPKNALKDVAMAKKKETFPDTTKKFLMLIVFVPLIPVLLLLIPLILTYEFLRGLWLRFMVKQKWYPRKKYLLFVYSNSPNWKEYIETNILPVIADYAIVINWSERSHWDWKKKPLELKVFKHWTHVNRFSYKGKKKWTGNEFNPVAITFIPWWKSKVFRFWQPFRDLKHGKENPLKEMENNLYTVLAALK